MEEVKRFYVDKKEKGRNVYYTIHWSGFRKAESWKAIHSVPSMAGVYELYYQEPGKALKQLFFSMAWYGGIREHLRKDLDPSLLGDSPILRAFVEKYTCFFRYSFLENIHDMQDLCFFFSRKAPPDQSEPPQPTGRYSSIFVKEHDYQKLVTF
jgi:hypothetical protein